MVIPFYENQNQDVQNIKLEVLIKHDETEGNQYHLARTYNKPS